MSDRNVSRRGFIKASALGAASLPLAALPAEDRATAGPNPASPAPAELPLGAPETVEKRNGVPYRMFGKTGVKVSILGIGGYHIGVPPSGEEATRIIRRAVDEGLNFCDNAWEYHNGNSEVRMGNALQDGYRDKVFLMTKVCAREAKGAMEQLEESLKRLKTDHIDLWQFHECNYDNDPDWIFAKDGAIHAAVKAKEQGKVRFIGFTGHKSPHIHAKMLAQDFPWDAAQLPLNVMDTHYRSFAREVLPVLNQRGMGVVGMKPLGGNGGIPGSGHVTVEECFRYVWNLKIPVCLSGMDSEKVLLENIGHARKFQPEGAQEIATILAKVKEPSGDGRFERFKSTQDFDSTVHRKQHNLG
ncbi:MAG TPA: aldo/keto reductase [Planctomycetota bacterium]|nr:aldo/keto reductase [Planctomycetota bacterium]